MHSSPQRLPTSMLGVQEGPTQPRPGQGVKVALAGKRTVESVGAADALMDALELAAHEASRMQVRFKTRQWVGMCAHVQVCLQGSHDAAADPIAVADMQVPQLLCLSRPCHCSSTCCSVASRYLRSMYIV